MSFLEDFDNTLEAKMAECGVETNHIKALILGAPIRHELWAALQPAKRMWEYEHEMPVIEHMVVLVDEDNDKRFDIVI